MDLKKIVSLFQRAGAVRKGSFVLKDGSTSSIFVNLGAFSRARDLSDLARLYGQKILHHFSPEDLGLLFGPAYKGISLVVAISMALYRDEKLDIPFAYNRKERKDHGEGTQGGKESLLVGRVAEGSSILLIDDVFTSGGTKCEMVDFIREIAPSATIKGLFVAVDRNPQGSREFTEATGIPVYSLITLEELEREI